MAKEKTVLILYKEDFEKTHIWEDVCTILAVPMSAESVYIKVEAVEYEYDKQDDLYRYADEDDYRISMLQDEHRYQDNKKNI